MPEIRRRHVLYIPGYDPFPPRRYRELYRRESAAQAAISGYTIAQEKGRPAFGWTVAARIEGAEVHSDVEVLVWSDIVSESMSGSIPATYAQLVRTLWIYLRSGALFRLMRLRKGPVIAAFYPTVLLIAQLAAALALVVLGAWLGSGMVVLGWLFGGALGAVAGWGLLLWFRARDNRLFAYYLMHDFAFTARGRGAYAVELEARLASFGGRIAKAASGGADEVLVVGHSTGAHMAVSALADLIRDGRLPPGRVSLLTLGHVVPMVSFLPEAGRLRSDLHLMGGQDDVFWLDVTAPGDGCAFALCDPVAVSGVAPARQTGPLVLSAAFTQTLSPGRWRALRHRFFRLHFQYLCAFDRPGAYDYFRITAGPKTLAERFAGLRASPSRLTEPVNRHTDRTA
ncbi:hypothetical protein JSE7799_01840 [Jannaschia seosinensis]|uniref:Uncharacterized protein n=1 Tax=Jannaschia seosinensis TaxID=313367 RepID=A0A0M7BAA3_9RHOB|nr:hypothetical protein [Jannaschia seosinensis]CUH39119.1 hypothetical protein JSE7799_01840 [Jannaschia seosinensis]